MEETQVTIKEAIQAFVAEALPPQQPRFRGEPEPMSERLDWKVLSHDVAEFWDSMTTDFAPDAMHDIAPCMAAQRHLLLEGALARYRISVNIALENAAGGQGNWLDLIDALGATVAYSATDGNAEELRENLVHLAAYAMGWALDLDRKGVTISPLEQEAVPA